MPPLEDIGRYLPQRPPLCFLRTLLDFNDDEVTTESIFEPESIAVGEDQVVENAALLELVAQSYAALRGYEDHKRGCGPTKGYLVGVTRFTAHAAAHAGDRLTVKARTTAALGNFFVGEGQVYRGCEMIADGTIKVWIETD